MAGVTALSEHNPFMPYDPPPYYPASETDAYLLLKAKLDEDELKRFENYMRVKRTIDEVHAAYLRGDLCQEELEVAVERILKRGDS
jgi:hypothetical protein